MNRNIDETANVQDLDTTWKYQFTVVNEDGDLTADPTLTVEVTDPTGTLVVHSVGGGVVSATTPTGTYNIDLSVAQLGDWFVRIITSLGDTYTIYVPVLT